jgi:hypothetical protein
MLQRDEKRVFDQARKLNGHIARAGARPSNQFRWQLQAISKANHVQNRSHRQAHAIDAGRDGILRFNTETRAKCTSYE